MSTEPEKNKTEVEAKAKAKVDTAAEKPLKASSKKPATAIQRQSKAKDSPSIDEERVSSEKKRKANLPGILFNLLLLGGLCFLAFMFFEQEKALDVVFTQQTEFAQDRSTTANDLLALQSQAQQLDELLVDAASRINAQELRLTQANNLIASQSSELEALNRELVRTRLKINDSGTAVNQEWLLAEAESLLRLAQQGLIVTGDVRAAIALFIASDDILKQINDPAIFSIRDSLAIDLRALRAVPEVDIQGLYFEIGELAERVESLEVISGSEDQLNSAQELTLYTEPEEANSTVMSAVFEKLGEYIVVRRRDEAIQPLLTSEQRLYLMQNIQLQIQQSRLALLREQEIIFSSSLRSAIENIERYLIGDSLEKQSILLALNNLKDSEIITRVPTVTSTLNALRAIIPESSGQIEAALVLPVPSIEVDNLIDEESNDVNELQEAEEL